MISEIVVFGGVISVIILIITRVAAGAKAPRLDKLEPIAQFLGGHHDGSSKAWGTGLGPKLTLQLTNRGAGSLIDYWTEIDVELPAGYPLEIHLRRHQAEDSARIARGQMVDLTLGDPGFDAAFRVEVAPADVARELLDPELRKLLTSYSDADLYTVDGGHGVRALRLGVRLWLSDVARARRPLEVMAKLGTRLRLAYAKADEAVDQPLAGDPYRPVADDRVVLAAQDARVAEVGTVKALRDARLARDRRIVIVVVVALLLVVSGIGLFVAGL